MNANEMTLALEKSETSRRYEAMTAVEAMLVDQFGLHFVTTIDKLFPTAGTAYLTIDGWDNRLALPFTTRDGFVALRVPAVVEVTVGNGFLRTLSSTKEITSPTELAEYIDYAEQRRLAGRAADDDARNTLLNN